MDINKISLKDVPTLNPELQAYKMYSEPDLEIVHLCLEPGDQIPLHVNPKTVIFYIIKGKGKLKLEGSEADLHLFDLAEVPSGMMRGMSNPYSEELRLLVIKKMKP